MEELRKLYQSEVKHPPTQRVPRFAGDEFGPEEVTDEYVEWLEKKAKPLKLEKEWIAQILEKCLYGGELSIDGYYVHVKFPTHKVSLRPEENRVEFWITTTHAYVAVTIPHPNSNNAYISKAIRWAFCTLLDVPNP